MTYSSKSLWTANVIWKHELFSFKLTTCTSQINLYLEKFSDDMSTWTMMCPRGQVRIFKVILFRSFLWMVKIPFSSGLGSRGGGKLTSYPAPVPCLIEFATIQKGLRFSHPEAWLHPTSSFPGAEG